MKKFIVFVGLLWMAGFCFAQQDLPSKVIGALPKPGSTAVYYVQVGAFLYAHNAVNAANTLENSGFTVVFENFRNLTRVSAANIPASSLNTSLQRIKQLGFDTVIVREARLTSNAVGDAGRQSTPGSLMTIPQQNEAVPLPPESTRQDELDQLIDDLLDDRVDFFSLLNQMSWDSVLGSFNHYPELPINGFDAAEKKRLIESGRRITMTILTQGNSIICMTGSGYALIDWGDETEIEAYRLSGNSLMSIYSHDYSGPSSNIITIYGDNITMLNCNGYAYYQNITALDVSRNPALTYLDCSYNQLTMLDLTQNPALEYLDCSNNQLTVLNLKNSSLQEFYCQENRLTNLDVSNYGRLYRLTLQNNQFSSNALNDLFHTLHANTTQYEKRITISNNPETDGCDMTIATAKGWLVEMLNGWISFE